MKRRIRMFLAVTAAATVIGGAATRSPASPVDRIGEKLKDATLRDLHGKEANLLAFHGGKALVIAYTGLGCPISRRYAPRLMSLYEEFHPKGVAFVAINANPQDPLKAIGRAMKELGITFPVLQDKNQDLTRQLDARTTTEVFVVDADKVVRYRGMIDDQYAVGEKRKKPRNHYLKKALRDVLRGKAPHTARTAAPGCVIARTPTDEKKETKGKVTYARHISRIMQKRCITCHRAGQVGPFPLTDYSHVAGWSAMIQYVVEDGRMPPWNADDPFDGRFVNERNLSKKEKAMLLAWIAGGMPRGDPKMEPKPRKWPKQWRIGKPDKIYRMKESFLVPKDGTVEYQYFEIPTDFKEDKWIVAMEAHPGAAEVVHHILAFIIPKDQKVNSGRIGLEDGYLCATVPGDTPSIFPPGCAKRLPAGAKIVLQMHYTTNGKAARDRSAIGLRFARDPIEREVFTRGIYNLSFEIPAGDSAYEVRSEWKTDTDIEIFAFMPHMHTRGKSFKYLLFEADAAPDAEPTTILSVSRYDFNWQESYILKKPLIIKAGSRFECIAVFDNSEENFENPDPKSPVRWGEQTWEEMMIGYVDWAPAVKADEQTAMAGS